MEVEIRFKDKSKRYESKKYHFKHLPDVGDTIILDENKAILSYTVDQRIFDISNNKVTLVLI